MVLSYFKEPVTCPHCTRDKDAPEFIFPMGPPQVHTDPRPTESMDAVGQHVHNRSAAHHYFRCSNGHRWSLTAIGNRCNYPGCNWNRNIVRKVKEL